MNGNHVSRRNAPGLGGGVEQVQYIPEEAGLTITKAKKEVHGSTRIEARYPPGTLS